MKEYLLHILLQLEVEFSIYLMYRI